MRKPDLEVREVVCSETGKPMTKIPLWMADVKVKFVSDEARQKHPTVPGLVDVDPVRRGSVAPEPAENRISGIIEVPLEEADREFDNPDDEANEDYDA